MVTVTGFNISPSHSTDKGVSVFGVAGVYSQYPFTLFTVFGAFFLVVGPGLFV